LGRFSRKALGAATMTILTVSMSVPASAAGCWTQAEVSAAKVHEMQTRLMIAANACRADGIDRLQSYDSFVAAKRVALSAADARLKDHFMATAGEAGAQAYDRYAAALEQAYGAAVASRDSCAEAALLASEAAASRGDLAVFADREIAVATLPSSICRVDAPVLLAAK
jgi:hypothetical protein